MKKTIKVALFKDQINAINTLHTAFDGCEVQLLNYDTDLTLMNLLTIPILSIHYYLVYGREKRGNTNLIDAICSVPSSVENLLYHSEDLMHFMEVCHYARQFNCPIVLHAVGPLDFHSAALLRQFALLVKREKVRVCLENIGSSFRMINQPKHMSIMEPVEWSKLLNSLAGEKVFYPLFDICHGKIFSKDVMRLNDKEVVSNICRCIEAYTSDMPYIHFCNAVGDGTGKNHGQNFSRYYDEMAIYLNKIKEVNPNTTLVLEVYEEDYINKPNSEELLRMIQKWEKKIMS